MIILKTVSFRIYVIGSNLNCMHTHTHIQATGSRLGTLIETMVGMVASLIIAFVYSWMLTLVLFGFVPLFVIGGFLELQAITGHAGSSKKALEEAGKVSY